jgi:protein disulfide-isomerase A6
MARVVLALVALVALAGCAHASLYDANSAVEQLTTANFDEKVTNSDELWIIEFYAPWCGHCKSLAPEWEKSAKALKGLYHVGAVDATVDPDLAGRFKVSGYPTIYIFGADKKKPEDYTGGRTASDIVDAVSKAARDLARLRLTGKKGGSGSSSSSKGGKKDEKKKAGGASDVVELTVENFEREVLESKEAWMVEFFAPWCGHCKSLAPEWEKLATELKGTIKVGALDATVHAEISNKYGVKGYPTLKFFAPKDKEDPIDIQTARNANALAEWGLAKLEELGVGPKVDEVASEEEIKECYKKPLCFVGVLPHLVEGGAEARNGYISSLQQLLAAKDVRGKANVVWMQGGTQPEFEQAFNLNFGYPAFVGISAGKQRYAVHRKAFSADQLIATAGALTGGKRGVSTTPIKAMPTLTKGTKWDGSDYVAPAEEEL